MKAEIVTKRFVQCPRCHAESWTVDHLEPGRSWGPWSCPSRECTAAVSGVIQEDGSIDLEVSDKPGHVLALFKYGSLYMAVGGYAEAKPDHYDFLFHSHQCTTNLLRGAVVVYHEETGVDPHGALRLVSVIPDSTAVRDKIGAGDQSNGDQTVELLLETFKTDGQPLPSRWS